ncbi:Putative ribonuclease H protein At1g65750 [Linum perenne]
MQTAFLPLSLCDKIDRKVRDFIWGSSDGVRKIHNVNWDSMCKPKSMGGLGLRSARDLNKAFLMKVVWGILTKPDEMWASSIISKYLIRNSVYFTLKRKSGFSSLCRGVLKVWDYTLQGLQWSVKNGRNTKFWTDRWLDSGVIMRDFSTNNQGVDTSLTVSHFVSSDGNWDVDRLSGCLQNAALVQVLGMIPPCDQLGDDSISWGLETSGRFSVKTAYLLVKEIAEDGNNTKWKKVWTWEEPAKIKHFMWLVTHGKLITNEERQCRHISPDATCTECLDPCESVEHVIRRCRLAQDVWRELLPSAIIGTSAINAFLDWWIAGIDYKPNRILFGVTSWLLWHRRN